MGKACMHATTWGAARCAAFDWAGTSTSKPPSRSCTIWKPILMRRRTSTTGSGTWHSACGLDSRHFTKSISGRHKVRQIRRSFRASAPLVI